MSNVEEISSVGVSLLPFEREHDDDSSFGFHFKVGQMYREKGYHLRPTTEQEARERGEKHWNGVAISAVHIDRKDSEIAITTAPMRYLIRQAYVDVLKNWPATKRSPILFSNMTPRVLGLSLLLPTKVKDQYGIIAQVKGFAVNEGKIHAAAVAGGLEPKSFYRPDPAFSVFPLRRGLKTEALEEIGMSSDFFSNVKFRYQVNQPETGFVSIAAVPKKLTNLPEILDGFNDYASSLDPYKKPEVAGLAFLPFDKSGFELSGIDCYVLDADKNLVQQSRDITSENFHPYTKAFHEYFSKKNIGRFLEGLQ